jgi:hypothetical protein
MPSKESGTTKVQVQIQVNPSQSNKADSGEIHLSDNEAVKLLIYFYKLHFLGTQFSKKMLKIDL